MGPSKPRTLQHQITSSDSSDSSDSSSDSDESDVSDNKLFARLKKHKIFDLLGIGKKDQNNKNRLRHSKTNKNYGEITEKSDDAESKRLAKERIIDLLEAAAKKGNYNNRLTYSQDKNYGQMAFKADDSDKNRLESEKIIDLIEAAAKKNTYDNRLTFSNDKNYGQMALKANNKRLESDSILDLIEAVAKAEDTRNSRVTNHKEKPNYVQTSSLVNSENSDSIRSSNTHVQKQILEKLFSQLSNGEKRPKKRLIPNPLTPTVTMNDVKKYYAKQNKNIEVSKEQEITGLEDYSKIYIVLNPEAAQKSKNKNSLNDL